ncbi:hypothetical protein RhiirC2_795242 [Rhizophagus irregularis]|uniref:Protein kinase domain-containing protein n=1 Tax=Rhizophagus irregularis TaxID=588596 RepID=A0A2N1MBY8_9GLOM|nr:hypothetical protein RhiirC2_795242 [Rhizophagus irregularis]
MSTETDNTFSIENYSIQNGEYYFYERFFSYVEKMDCGSVNNKMYKANMNKCLLVISYTEGRTLRNYLDERFSLMGWEIKCRFGCEISNAIRYMHINGVVHEDLNSNNILVHQNSIRISDFGLSRRIKNKSKISYDALPYDAPERQGVTLGTVYGKIPFSDRKYDANLAKEINTPKSWNGDPDMRPTIHKVITAMLMPQVNM